MDASDKVWITELTLIHKIVRSIRNSHVQELTLILKIIGQCDIKHILTSLNNNNASFEDLDLNYHSSFCLTCCDTSNNVCLDLQNCRYSILIINLYKLFVWFSLRDIVSINRWTLILIIISQCDVKQILMWLLKK